MKAFVALLALAATAATSTLQQQIAAIAAKVPAVVGVAAVDLKSGKSVSLRGDERFPMGSVFKLPVALEFLRRVDRKEFNLGESVTIPVSTFAPGFSPIRDHANGKPVTLTYGEILAAMLRDSDNTAADFLLPKCGGGKRVTQRLRELGIRNIRVDRSEREMANDLSAKGGVARYAADPRDTATPNAAIELLRLVQRGGEGLSPTSHALVLKLMSKTGTGAKRIKAGLPPGTRFAHKTGTMPGTANDIGIIDDRILIAIFTKAAKTESIDAQEAAMSEIGKAVYATVSSRP